MKGFLERDLTEGLLCFNYSSQRDQSVVESIREKLSFLLKVFKIATKTLLINFPNFLMKIYSSGFE